MADKVHVPQEDGTISIAVDGDEPRNYQVTDHIVSPKNEQEHRQLLVHVDGARKATAADLKPSKPASGGN